MYGNQSEVGANDRLMNKIIFHPLIGQLLMGEKYPLILIIKLMIKIMIAFKNQSYSCRDFNVF
jgi:hypothetical protein